MESNRQIVAVTSVKDDPARLFDQSRSQVSLFHLPRSEVIHSHAPISTARW